MKIAASTPATRALLDEMLNGLSQLRDGWIEFAGSEVYTFHSATTANRNRVTISAASRKYWVLADASIPT